MLSQLGDTEYSVSEEVEIFDHLKVVSDIFVFIFFGLGQKKQKYLNTILSIIPPNYYHLFRPQNVILIFYLPSKIIISCFATVFKALEKLTLINCYIKLFLPINEQINIHALL